MASLRTILPALLLTCVLMTGCTHIFPSTASRDGEEFTTDRLLAMAEAFESQGDYERANALHEEIRLRDPHTAYLTSSQNSSPTEPSSTNPSLEKLFTSDEAPEDLEDQSQTTLTVTEAVSPNMNKVNQEAAFLAGETENILEVYPPFNESDQTEIVATKSNTIFDEEYELINSETPIFIEDETRLSNIEGTESAIGNSSRSIEENSLPLDSRESPVEETEFVSASSDLRPSDSGVTFALHETVSQSPESNSSFQPKRTAQTQTNSEEDFSLPSIRR